MSSLQSSIQLIRDNHAYLSAEYAVDKVGIFGSVAKQTDHAGSDIDIVVEFRQPIGFKFIALTQYLEQLLGKKVDVLTPDGITNIRRKNIANNIMQSVIYVYYGSDPSSAVQNKENW